ncbi:MAG: acetyltransferase [Nitrosospira sp.]|nr:acetyltransferase [Nitrosospira sp.]
MANFDVFNGDADGILALHQLRLSEPRDSILITGVKRDIDLLRKVHASAGDSIVVLDVSLDKNREALQSLLEQGAQITYVDHHFAGDIPPHPALRVMIDPAPEVCTSWLVDRMLHGRFRIWMVVAAFGDNLPACAMRWAAPLSLSGQRLGLLRELGDCLNYNAYGDTMDDLFFHPAELYRRLHRYTDPFDFINKETIFEILKQGYTADMAMAQAMQPERRYAGGSAYILPDQSWSRRISGAFGNYLVQAEPDIAHAVLTRKPGGGYGVSVRAPRVNPTGADDLCYRFETGGGRKSAAGVNHLPESDLALFLDRFDAAFQASF